MEINDLIKIIFTGKQAEEIQKIADDFKNLHSISFYEKYEEKLYLQYCEHIEIFQAIQKKLAGKFNSVISNYSFNEKDLKELIIWIMLNEEIIFFVDWNEQDLKTNIIVIVN